MKNKRRMVVLLLVSALCLGLLGCQPAAPDSSSLPMSAGDSSTDATGAASSTLTSSDGSGSSSVTNPSDGEDPISNPNSTSSQTSTSSGSKVNTQALKDKLDFGGETIKIVYTYDMSERGTSAAADKFWDKVDRISKDFNVDLQVGLGSTAYEQMMITTILAGQPFGHICLTRNQISWLKAGIMAPLDEAMKKTGIDFSEEHYSQFMSRYYNYNGHQYGFSTGGQINNGWFYNKRIFSQMRLEDPQELYAAGKWTWSKVTELAKKATIREADGSISQYGLGFWHVGNSVIGMAMNNGCAVAGFNAEGKPTVNMKDPRVLEALEQLYQWGFVDKVATSWKSGSWDSLIVEFRDGKIALMSSTAATPGVLYTMSDDWGFVPPPLGPSGKQHVASVDMGESFFIPKTYTDMADKLLLLMDEYVKPEKGQSKDDAFRSSWVTRFRDKTSYNLFKSMYYDLPIVYDVTADWNLTWGGSTAFAARVDQIFNGTTTPGTMVETYADVAQTEVNDLFAGLEWTGNK